MGRRNVKTKLPLLILLAVLFGVASLFSVLGGEKRVVSPTITPSGGHYSLRATVRVAIRAEPGCRIIYTLDGTMPAENNGVRCDANAVFFDLPSGDVTVMAAAFRTGMGRSVVTRAVFTRSG